MLVPTSGYEAFGPMVATHSLIQGCSIPTRQAIGLEAFSLYRKFESDKKREYSERINVVEHGSFTPLVFSACGGIGREATVAIKKLAAQLATKRNENYCHLISWIRCCHSFSLARSAIRCVRGSRSIRRRTHLRMDGHGLAPVDLVQAEAIFFLLLSQTVPWIVVMTYLSISK